MSIQTERDFHIKGDEMTQLDAKRIVITIVFAFIGWVACGATMGIGMALSTLETTLIIHAIGAPIYFFILSYIYFRKFGYTKPIVTAAIFVGFVIVIDFFFVALIINESLDMFRNFIGTWLPFILIFTVTWLTGKIVGSQKRSHIPS
jgi:hypothetical protein